MRHAFDCFLFFKHTNLIYNHKYIHLNYQIHSSSIFTEVYSHQHNLLFESFHHPPQYILYSRPVSPYYASLSTPAPEPFLSNHWSTFCLCSLPTQDGSYKWNYTICLTTVLILRGWKLLTQMANIWYFAIWHIFWHFLQNDYWYSLLIFFVQCYYVL